MAKAFSHLETPKSIFRNDPLCAIIRTVMTDEQATTKPTLETILERIGALAAQVQEFHQEFQEFRKETRANFDLLGRKLDVLGKDVLDVPARQSLLEDKIEKLERRPFIDVFQSLTR
jgi:hypothetical protein